MGIFASKSTQKSPNNSQIIPSRNRLSKPNQLSSGNSLSTFKSPALVQPKLIINEPNDKYEQETDRVAYKVMRMPESAIKRKPT